MEGWREARNGPQMKLSPHGKNFRREYCAPTILDCWNKCLNFILLPDCFPKKLKHFLHLLSNVQRTVFLYFCIVLGIITLFFSCHSNGCQVFHFYLICICLTSRKTEHLFTYHLSLQLCRLPIQMPRPFHYWVVFGFLLWMCL